MSDLLVGFGLVLVFEGLVWALAPGTAVSMLAAAASARQQTLRLTGAIAVAAGVVVIWLVRG
jgi:uncharacterized protein YjeT (DUF2065 family)